MKHLLVVATSLLLGHAAWSDSVAPTYLKMVVTDNAGHGGACQISRLAFFDAEHGCVSVDLTQKAAGIAATELDENSFSPLLDYDGYDKPVSRIFNVNDNKWCFSWTDHIKDTTITLTMRLAATARPVAYNFRSGGDDATYPDRSLSSWVLYGSADGVNWDVCDIVRNLPAVGANHTWYPGPIAEGNNAGCFPVAMIAPEARGTLSAQRVSMPGVFPMVTLDSYGTGATSASVVTEWSLTDDFAEVIFSRPLTLSGLSQLKGAQLLPVPAGLAAGTPYWVRARVTNDQNVSTVFGPVSCSIQAAPDVSSYLMRALFTVGYETEDSMDDFRVLVRLAENKPTGFTYSQCAADGSDMLFTSADGTTAYYFDVDTWNPQGESCIWVRLPRAKKGDAFSMYYGKTGAASAADSAGTWSGYKGVWHMNETITAETAATTKSKNATGDTALDAEPKHGTGCSDDALKEMVSVDGSVGLARKNGSAGSKRNYLSVPSYSDVGGEFTVSGWFKADGANGNQRVISRKDVYNSADGFECEMPANDTRITVRGASSAGPNVDLDNLSSAWRHLVLVYAGAAVTVYQDGVFKGSGAVAAVTDNGKPLSFGNNSNGSEQSFGGQYDEIRLQKGALSATRVAAEYATVAEPNFLSCTGVASTDPDMPMLDAASVEWKDGATTVSLTLKAGIGAVSAVFTDVLTGTVYEVPLAAELDAREGVQAKSYALTAEQLPLDATYTWVVAVTNDKFDLPAKIVGAAKYYSGNADPTVRYVATTGSDENDGMLLARAMATLQAAIDSLGEDGGTVYIDDGEYAFTSDTDTAVTITTPVHVIGLSRDPSKVTITRTGTPKRNFVINHADCSLEFVTITGGTLEDDNGTSVSLRNGLLADCVITGANCQSWKCHGALYADGNSRVVRCVLHDNYGWFNGSALQTAGNAVIENCLFYGNVNNGGDANGGGTVSLGGASRFVNCTVAGNSGVGSTGVYASNYANPQVRNCAIFGNTATSDTTGRGHIWNGKAEVFDHCASETAINDNCFALSPGFRDAANRDYTLSSASGLIDRGLDYTKTGAISETDLAGNARLVDDVDIGCYEYTKKGLDVGFDASVSEGLMPLSVTFTAKVSGTSDDVSYAWDFDNDGITDRTTDTPVVVHEYTTAGRVSIGLTVTTASGGSAKAELLDAILISPPVVYADSANAAGAEFPYNTPEKATPDLALAIATAGNGSTVLVADGTYESATEGGFRVDKNLRVQSISQHPTQCVVKDKQGVGEFTGRRVLVVNHQSAVIAGLTLEGGYQGTELGATLYFGSLGGVVSNCVIRSGYIRDWGGDAALAYVTANAVVTHSVFEQGLAKDDLDPKNSRPWTCSVRVEGLVDNCLVRDFNRDAGNQNLVTVYNGGKLLNCTIMNGLCGNPRGEDQPPCAGVMAREGARVENCAIVGVRHQESDETFSVRAWNGDPKAFANCATDTEKPINDTCVTVTTAAFKDYAAKDYRPTSGSLLIDKGRKNELADGTDLIGNRRAVGAMDIGCYEAAQGMIIYIR